MMIVKLLFLKKIIRVIINKQRRTKDIYMIHILIIQKKLNLMIYVWNNKNKIKMMK